MPVRAEVRRRIMLAFRLTAAHRRYERIVETNESPEAARIAQTEVITLGRALADHILGTDLPRPIGQSVEEAITKIVKEGDAG